VDRREAIDLHPGVGNRPHQDDAQDEHQDGERAGDRKPGQAHERILGTVEVKGPAAVPTSGSSAHTRKLHAGAPLPRPGPSPMTWPPVGPLQVLYGITV